MPTDIELRLHLSPNAAEPIYRQLMAQIQRLVAGGQLQPGDTVPSVRQLAARFEVNPMTISKAYSLLEMEGTLTRLRGKGMQVSPDQRRQPGTEDRLARLQPSLERLADEARQLDLPPHAVLQALQGLLEKEL